MINLFDTNNVRPGANPHSHRSRPGQTGQWQSANGYDLMVPVGTEVYSLTDGTVTSMNQNHVRTGSIYGDRVTIQSNNDEIYYTHIQSNVSKNQKVKKGDLIGKVVKWETNPKQSHLHIASKNGDIKNYVNFKNWAIVGATNSSNSGEDETNNNTEKPPKDTTSTDIEQALTRDFYQLYAPVALPTGVMGLAGENRSTQKLLEQIERIKKLM
jgi:murein DD-endopeptidase MepM/ murein hydrolase activator NlpD